MANGTKQQWLNLSQQLRKNTTPRELGEAVLALAQGKRAASPNPDYRIWIAVVIGAVFMLSIGVSREVTNSRALSAQVESEKSAHAEANRQTEIAREAQAEAEEVHRQYEDYSLALGNQVAEMWREGRYDHALTLLDAAHDSGEHPLVGLRVLRDGPYDGDIEQMQRDLQQLKDESK